MKILLRDWLMEQQRTGKIRSIQLRRSWESTSDSYANAGHYEYGIMVYWSGDASPVFYTFEELNNNREM